MLATVPMLPSKRGNFLSEHSDKSSDISDAMRLVRIAAAPVQIGDNVKSQIARAAGILGWSYTRTRDVWHGSARRIDAHAMDRLRAVERGRDRAQLDFQRQRHREQLAALRARLAARDPDFHREDIAALDWLLSLAI